MNVFLDIDGVCSDFSHIIAEVTGSNKPMECYYFSDFGPRQQAAAKAALPRAPKEGLPFPGMAELSHKIAERHTLRYLTARHISTEQDTLSWLANNGFYRGEVIFNTDKADVLSEYSDAVIVEDYGPNIEAIIAKTDAKCIALCRPQQMYTNYWYVDYVIRCGHSRNLLAVTPESLESALESFGVDLSSPQKAPVLKESNPKDTLGAKKVPMSCLPTGVLAEAAVAMFEGATKYGRHNYRAIGVRASIYYDAAMRHLMRWWEGEDIDPDSGVSNVVKAITCLMVLRDAQQNGKVTDDRPPSLPDVGRMFEDLNKACVSIVETYGHIQPRHFVKGDDKV